MQLFELAHSKELTAFEHELVHSSCLVNRLNADGIALVHYVAVIGWLDGVKVLRRLGADMDIDCRNCRQAVDFARAMGHQDVVEELMRQK